MDDELRELVERARRHRMTPEGRERQRRSLMAGLANASRAEKSERDPVD